MSKKSLFAMTAVACACVILSGGCKSTHPDTLDRKLIDDGTGMNVGGLSSQPSKMGEKIIGVTFESVLFDYDSAKIMDSEYLKIETVATYLNGNPRSTAVLEGNCDERGTSEYNMTLGERRADAVRAHLLGLKIDAARLFPKSFGEEKPADPRHSEEAWRLNRRVDFSLYR